MADWTTIASMSTAVGTLVLAFATFSATRSSNRSARIAERALEAGLRPVLVPSRLEDPPEKLMWVDRHWTTVAGGRAAVELGDDAVYLAMSLRNVGTGMAVIHGWCGYPSVIFSMTEHSPPENFRPQTRDLYVPPGDTSFWQGAFRGDEPERLPMVDVIEQREAFTVELLYGDHEGGQRTISRFTVIPRGDASKPDPDSWLVTVSRHWNLDRADPR
jgi:hypothetical protein